MEIVPNQVLSARFYHRQLAVENGRIEVIPPNRNLAILYRERAHDRQADVHRR